MGGRNELSIPKWIALIDENVAFQIHPKGNKKIENDRTAKRKERQVNEINTYAGTGDIEFFAEVTAYTKQVVLN
jgi:hypothetical protein